MSPTSADKSVHSFSKRPQSKAGWRTRPVNCTKLYRTHTFRRVSPQNQVLTFFVHTKSDRRNFMKDPKRLEISQFTISFEGLKSNRGGSLFQHVYRIGQHIKITVWTIRMTKLSIVWNHIWRMLISEDIEQFQESSNRPHISSSPPWRPGIARQHKGAIWWCYIDPWKSCIIALNPFIHLL